MFVGILSLSSCSEEPDFKADEMKAVKETENIGLTVENGKLRFNSKEDIKTLIENKDEETFNDEIRNLQAEGFRPLTPVFLETETEAYEAFLSRKQEKMSQKGVLYSLRDEDEEPDLDEDEDELIADPDFAALLNEDRAIYVGDSLYVYTTEGAYISHIKHEELLWAYIENRSKELKDKQSLRAEVLCPYMLREGVEEERISMSTPMGTTSRVTDEISLFRSCPDGGGGGSPAPTPTPSPIPASIPLKIKQNFKFCSVQNKSEWQKAFGAVKKCTDYFDSKRRVKARFWNVNYGLWASMGVVVKFQKKALVGWRRSDAVDYTELGVSSLVYNVKSKYAKYFKDKFIGEYIRYRGIDHAIVGDQARMIGSGFPVIPNWAYNSRDKYPYDVQLFLFSKEVKGMNGSELKRYVINKVEKVLNIPNLRNDATNERISIIAIVPPVNDNEFRTVVVNRIEQRNDGKIKTDKLHVDLFNIKEIKWDSGKAQKLIDSGAMQDEDSEKALKDIVKNLPTVKIETANQANLKIMDIYGTCRRDGKTYKGVQFGLRD